MLLSTPIQTRIKPLLCDALRLAPKKATKPKESSPASLSEDYFRRSADSCLNWKPRLTGSNPTGRRSFAPNCFSPRRAPARAATRAGRAGKSPPWAGKCSRLAEVQNIRPVCRMNPDSHPGSGAHSKSEAGRMIASPELPGSRGRHRSFRVAWAALAMLTLAAAGCNRGRFPDVLPGYHEFAYVSNGAAETVSVLDLGYHTGRAAWR